MTELKKYDSGFLPEQDKIFKRCFNKSRWDKVRQKVRLGGFKFHDLRRTFGSVLAQSGVSTAEMRRLLEHSSADLTNKMYTNVDSVQHYGDYQTLTNHPDRPGCRALLKLPIERLPEHIP